MTYNLLSGCSVCQGGEVGSWSDWIQNCPANVTDPDKFPLGVSMSTSIPDWARTLPSTTSGYFSASYAMSIVGYHAPKHISVPTIVLAILGGLGGLILVAIIVVVWYQRRQSRPPVTTAAQASAVPLGPYDGVRRDSFDSSDPFDDQKPFKGYTGTHGGSPRSTIRSSLYDPPPAPSSSGHGITGSPRSRPSTLHGATFPQYPVLPSHGEMYDPYQAQQHAHSSASLIADDWYSSQRSGSSAGPIGDPRKSMEQKRYKYEGIMKLERLGAKSPLP